MKLFSLILILVSFPALLFSHPGHGDFVGSWMHYLTSIQHMVPIVLPIAALWMMYRSYLNSRKKESLK